MIQAKQLVKWYGPALAVNQVSFEIPQGQVVGFLGPNGAGKSTTLRILTGYLPPTSGKAVIHGQDVLTAPESARASIGYLPENNPLYPEMRVEEYLDYRGQLHRMNRPSRRLRMEYVIERCGLKPVQRKLIGQLSKGNRQRVGLAQALLHEPPVLILDEPTAGLDPNQVTLFRELIADLRGKHTILLSTHILPEVEKLADRIIIIAGGRIAAEGTLDELRKKVASGSRVVLEVKAEPESVQRVLGQVEGVAGVEVSTQAGWSRAMVSSQDQRDLRESLSRAVIASGWVLREMRFETAGLEQFFIQITAAQSHAA